MQFCVDSANWPKYSRKPDINREKKANFKRKTHFSQAKALSKRRIRPSEKDFKKIRDFTNKRVVLTQRLWKIILLSFKLSEKSK